MRVCEMVWTPQRAHEVSSLVERATGKPCPCKVGRACPFVKSVETGDDEAASLGLVDA